MGFEAQETEGTGNCCFGLWNFDTESFLDLASIFGFKIISPLLAFLETLDTFHKKMFFFVILSLFSLM